MVTAREFFLGLDLGQKRDHTAIAIIERARIRTGTLDPVTRTPIVGTEYTLGHIERVPLGTSYPSIVDRVRQLLEPLRVQARCTLMVDETGVGAPVVDLLRAAALKCELVPVTITSGDASRRAERGRWLVPKRDLISGLQVMLEQGELNVPSRLRDAANFFDELRNMRVRIAGSGHEAYGAWREGTHDDLVFAVALACWRGRVRHSPPVWGPVRLV